MSTRYCPIHRIHEDGACPWCTAQWNATTMTPPDQPTLRDSFAMAVVKGLIARYGENFVPLAVWQITDAVLAERDREKL